jgi:predicted AAA+ superfamily ATPase
MLERTITDHILRVSKKMPIVTIIGPRQSGKTTLARAAFFSHEYVSLERPDERSFAIRDPMGFLARFKEGVILDEVQRAPELLSYIQTIVDEADRPGRFVLTGSQNFLLMQKVSQSLAGRSAIFTLLPFSLSELRKIQAIEPADLHNGSSISDVPEVDIWQCVFTGFYPRIHDKDLDPQEWLADYHRTYVERDIRDILQIMDLDSFDRFVRLAASRTGQELNLASLASDSGIAETTAKQWISVLRTSSLVILLKPHYNNFRKRLRKRPKLHFLDTGLVCYLLGIRSKEMLANHPLRGAIFESFVVSEMTKAFIHTGREAPLFHWRDATGHEIDILVDFGDRLLPIEVKSGMTLGADALVNLHWWLGIEGNEAKSGVLVYGGTQCFQREDIQVRPWWIG